MKGVEEETLNTGVSGVFLLKYGTKMFLQSGAANTVEVPAKEETEAEGLHSTPVLFSASDEFLKTQDMCLCCGSFGRDAEGQLIVCSQCGQCYHPYCVGVKVRTYTNSDENHNHNYNINDKYIYIVFIQTLL